MVRESRLTGLTKRPPATLATPDVLVHSRRTINISIKSTLNSVTSITLAGIRACSVHYTRIHPTLSWTPATRAPSGLRYQRSIRALITLMTLTFNQTGRPAIFVTVL